MNAFGLSGLFLIISSLGMAVLVFFKNREKPANKIWIIFNIFVSIWGFGALKMSMVNEVQSAIFYWRIVHAGITFVPVLFMHFAYEFLEEKKDWLLYLVYFISFLFVPLIFTGLFIKNVSWVFNSFYYPGRPPTILYLIFNIFWIATVILTHIKLYKRYLKSAGVTKLQIKYFLLGVFISFSGAIMCFLPVYFIDIYPYANFAAALYPIVITYSILTYRLMDVQLIFSRSIIVMLFGICVIVFHLLFMNYFSLLIGYNFSSVISLIIILYILLGTKTIKRLQSKVDNIVLKDKYDYQKILKDASEAVVGILDIDDLLNYIIEVIRKSLGVNKIALLMKSTGTSYVLRWSYGIPQEKFDNYEIRNGIVSWINKRKEVFVREEEKMMLNTKNFMAIYHEIDQIDAEVAVPLFYKDKLEGILTLNTKADGEPYSQSDIDLLKILASQLAIAIKNAELYEAAITDSLTGLFHHKYFKMRLEEEVEKVKRYKRPLSLLMIDLDNFKDINDNYGHQMGDEILKKTVNILKQKTRKVDIVARYGGDEFSIILPEIDLKVAYTISERIRKHLKDTLSVAEKLRENMLHEGFKTNDGKPLNITMSIGVACFEENEKELTSSELIRRADSALYQAKNNGNNRTEVWNKDILKNEQI